MSDPDWSQEHVDRGNKFFAQVAVAWVALLAVNLVFSHTGVFGAVLVGVLALFATWLLVHALFEHVDQLVKTRVEEANGGDAGGQRSDAAASD